MRIFIFGAGASQASQKELYSNKLKSPLINDLFGNEYCCYKIKNY